MDPLVRVMSDYLKLHNYFLQAKDKSKDLRILKSEHSHAMRNFDDVVDKGYELLILITDNYQFDLHEGIIAHVSDK